MMERVVYVGPYNSRKSDFLFGKAVEYLMENKGIGSTIYCQMEICW